MYFEKAKANEETPTLADNNANQWQTFAFAGLALFPPAKNKWDKKNKEGERWGEHDSKLVCGRKE